MISAVALLFAAQTAPAPSFFLDSEQIERLHTTKQAVFLPTFIPKDFQTAVHVDVGPNPQDVGYQVDYVLGKKEFWIQSANDGIGDVFLQDEDGKDIEGKLYTVKHKTLGKIQIEVGPAPFRRWAMNWIETPGKGYPNYLSMGGNGCEPATIQRIVASIRELPK